jgi:outer membrane protein TolC
MKNKWGISQMSGVNIFRALILCLTPFLLTACQPQDFGRLKPDFSQIQKVPTSILNIGKMFEGSENENAVVVERDSPLPMKDILGDSLATKNRGTDFLTSIKYALDTDPEIVSKRRQIEARLASVGASEAQKDFQVGATLYGGIEDVTDNTKGLALAINASRSVFDGGKLDSQIASSLFEVEASKMDLAATIDRRANELFQKWLELEKYKSLQAQIDKRLLVLDPLIDQLEKVAEAGIGDVSKVTAAQRTVSAIRVEKTSVSEGLAQAQLGFLNAYGALNNGVTFDYGFITNLVPSEIDDNVVQNSPMLKSQYASYQSSLERVKALRAKEGFDVGFEARAMRPFAGSGYDSDESIGLVGRKTLFNGGMLASEIEEAEAVSKARLAQIKATYRSGAQSVEAAIQNIESMEKAILISRENAKLTSDEIVHLRQQLIIGGSTLDSVLSAEARLYEAESKEIKFLTEKYKSEVLVVSSLGLLSRALGY